jgi:hypothetical protein
MRPAVLATPPATNSLEQKTRTRPPRPRPYSDGAVVWVTRVHGHGARGAAATGVGFYGIPRASVHEVHRALGDHGRRVASRLRCAHAALGFAQGSCGAPGETTRGDLGSAAAASDIHVASLRRAGALILRDAARATSACFDFDCPVTAAAISQVHLAHGAWCSGVVGGASGSSVGRRRTTRIWWCHGREWVRLWRHRHRRELGAATTCREDRITHGVSHGALRALTSRGRVACGAPGGATAAFFFELWSADVFAGFTS